MKRKNKIITPEKPDIKKTKCFSVSDKKVIKNSYFKYLSDESKYSPEIPDRIYFPESTLEVSAAVREIIKQKGKITVSGGRTGIASGAASTSGASIISLENLLKKPEITFNKNFNCHSIKVSAGIKLSEINDFIKINCKGFFYPVDPTETNATAGGMVSTNASGARTFFYGATREWVIGFTAILSDGSILHIKRGEYFSENGKFHLFINGNIEEIVVKNIKMPSTKHNAGYFVKEKMDFIDLFIGSEGTLGIITEVELKLAPVHENILYLTFFLTGKNFLELSAGIKNAKTFKPLAVEYIDKNAIKLLKKEDIPAGIPKKIYGTLYLEIPFNDIKHFNKIYSELENILSSNGFSPKNSWAGFSNKEFIEMKKFRHAVPERINELIAYKKRKIPTLTKVGTDMAIPDDKFPEMMSIYKKELKKAGLRYCIFGHLGNNHLHINILPNSLNGLKRSKELYKKFAASAVSFGGSVSAEHGIGRLKKDFLKIQYDENDLKTMKKIKTKFDPENILNLGVLW
jgi:D-lactate dehydrogenase (cytochrome)